MCSDWSRIESSYVAITPRVVIIVIVTDQLMLLFSLSSNDLSPLYQARCAATKKLIADHGPNAYLIPSSDHPHIIAGQGSIAVEFLEQVASFFKYQSNV